MLSEARAPGSPQAGPHWVSLCFECQSAGWFSDQNLHCELCPGLLGQWHYARESGLGAHPLTCECSFVKQADKSHYLCQLLQSSVMTPGDAGTALGLTGQLDQYPHPKTYRSENVGTLPFVMAAIKTRILCEFCDFGTPQSIWRQRH